MSSKLQKNKGGGEIKVSDREKEVLREIVKSEKANLQVFSLSNEQESKKYERLLNRLDGKLA